jgi:catechol 2,3-dioxygenase-like lactoylglutathione lyase family enzyme
MLNRLDHVVLAVADLAIAKAAFADETGVVPVDGGPHRGVGTRNALVSFGTSYLEILAPDPEQELVANMGAALLDLEAPRLLHWAVRVDDLAAVAAHARACGLDPSGIRHLSRHTPSGLALDWSVLGVGGHRLGGVVPFYIDWLDCPHPADSAPRVGPARFEVTLPNGSREARLLTPVPDGVEVRGGPPCLRLAFESPRGPVEWVEAAPAGFRFGR